jgi:hypothetical protein
MILGRKPFSRKLRARFLLKLARFFNQCPKSIRRLNPNGSRSAELPLGANSMRSTSRAGARGSVVATPTSPIPAWAARRRGPGIGGARKSRAR